MTAGLTDLELGRLRREAELSLERCESQKAQRLLESLAKHAVAASQNALFAHRHLGELKLESNPWAAALHLRRCLQWDHDNHILHALMGLAQALLGNYKSAISAYRHANKLSTRNPWYHHNLGHLLDVALGQPEKALPHLDEAHRLEASQHEITASLAHCLARLGRLQDAADMASLAVAMAPQNDHHRSLAAWIRAGARRGDLSSPMELPLVGATVEENLRPMARVAAVIQREMRAAGFNATEVETALDMWDDYWLDSAPPGAGKPEVYAAAIVYAVVKIYDLSGFTQAQIADRFCVSASALSRRFRRVMEALSLEPHDPRYIG